MGLRSINNELKKRNQLATPSLLKDDDMILFNEEEITSPQGYLENRRDSSDLRISQNLRSRVGVFPRTNTHHSTHFNA